MLWNFALDGRRAVNRKDRAMIDNTVEDLDFIFEALVRINDRQEPHSADTSEDLNDIQRAIERLRARHARRGGGSMLPRTRTTAEGFVILEVDKAGKATLRCWILPSDMCSRSLVDTLTNHSGNFQDHNYIVRRANIVEFDV